MNQIKAHLFAEVQEAHIINLIKDDLKNTALVSGLEELGLDSGKYYLNLGETIFALMNLGENEPLWEEYSNSLSMVSEFDIFAKPDKLEFLAGIIFNMLDNAQSKDKSIIGRSAKGRKRLPDKAYSHFLD